MKTPQRFLLIDDDEANNMLCSLTIRKVFGKETDVICFTEPEEGLSYIQTSVQQQPTPTLLLLDINMPSLSGWDVLQAFGNYDEHVKNNFIIYMLSSSVDPRDKEKAGANPHVAGFIEKPLTRVELEQFFPVTPA